MPELPEVEIAARNLRRWAEGQMITRAWCDPHAARMFRPSSPRATERALTGARLVRVDRRGKNLLWTMHTVDHDRTFGVVSHLGMTGKWVQAGETSGTGGASKTGERLHVRVRLDLTDGGVLLYRDPRMFGRLRVLPDVNFDAVADLAALGPDPLVDGVDAKRLGNALARTKRSVKLAVMDQSVLAGVGNIQASEALFLAGIDPRRAAASLSRAEVGRLAKGVSQTVRETIEREAGDEIVYLGETGAVNGFRVYDRAGEKCPRCKRGVIERAVQGARASFYCPRCQG